MTSKADILVSEIFDVGLLAEGAIPAFKHARQHLLQPNAKILPQSTPFWSKAKDYMMKIASPLHRDLMSVSSTLSHLLLVSVMNFSPLLQD